MTDLTHRTVIRPLTPEEGGGYLVEYPDFPGCIADGETVEEAIAEGEKALKAWIATAEEFDDPIPGHYSGQWRLRVPKSLHASLTRRAKEEGVSLNTLASILLAEGIERRTHLSSRD